jgi:hypothetical protein
LQLIVTGDINGNVRIWNRDKKFLREVKFPSRVDCVCFLNAKGDLLVSHAKRISLVKFTTYWTKVFDYYGVTCSQEDEELLQLGLDDESMFCDAEFVIEKELPRRVVIDSEDLMKIVISGKHQSAHNTEPDEVLQLIKFKSS